MGLNRDLGRVPEVLTVSGSNIGISKAVPNSKLDINGDTIVTGSLRVTQGITGSLFGTASFVNVSGLGGFVQGGNSFGAQALIGTNDNQSLALETNGSIRLTLAANGAATFSSTATAGGYLANGTTTIGIPVDTGGGKAYFNATDINGPALVLVADSVGRTIRLSSNTTGTTIGAIDSNSTGLNIGTNTNHPIIFNPNAAERMRITSGGSLLVGGTSDIAGGIIQALSSSDTVITTRTTVAGNGQPGIRFFHDGNDEFVIRGGSSLRFLSSGVNERMRITSGGNILIGTTTDNGPRLQVNGSISVGNSAGGAVGTLQLITGGASPISNRITYGTDGTGWRFAIGKNQGGTVTDQLIIHTNGNVLVGTTADEGYKMYVDGTIGTTTAFGSSRRVTITALNTDFQIFPAAFSGLVVIRDNTNGGSGAWIQDPNMGSIQIANNMPGTWVISYNFGNGTTNIRKTSGGVPVLIGYALYGNG